MFNTAYIPCHIVYLSCLFVRNLYGYKKNNQLDVNFKEKPAFLSLSRGEILLVDNEQRNGTVAMALRNDQPLNSRCELNTKISGSTG